MSIGRKGMVIAAKSLVLTAVDLFTDPKQVEAERLVLRSAAPVMSTGRAFHPIISRH